MKPRIVMGIVLLVLGCQAPQSSSPIGDTVLLLPRNRQPEEGTTESGATAAFKGRLTISRRCIRVADPETGEMTTVLWHHETELVDSGAGYSLRNRRNGVVRPFGEVVRFGGGGIRSNAVEREYPEVADRCGGPYVSGWLSG